MIFCTYLLIFKPIAQKFYIFFNCYAPSTAEGVFFVLCIKKKCIFAKNKHKWKI